MAASTPIKTAKLMRPDVVTCGSTDTLERAAQLMWDHDIGCVPAVDADGRLVGMLTDRDVCMAAYTRGAPLRDISVAETMATHVYSCTADSDVHIVEKLMAEHQVHRMPVIDGEARPIGLISLNDIARAASGNGAITSVEVTSTLLAITEPRRPNPPA
jgi:CBS domain-containing protein